MLTLIKKELNDNAHNVDYYGTVVFISTLDSIMNKHKKEEQQLIKILEDSIKYINQVRLSKENYYLQRAVQKILKVVKELEK